MALNEGVYAEEFILSELPGRISRDVVTVTVAATTTLDPGQVLGKITATGKYVPVDDTASDGRENAAGILVRELANAAGSPADFADALVLNFGAEVSEGGLIWGASDDAAGIADLAALGIKVRASVPGDGSLSVNG